MSLKHNVIKNALSLDKKSYSTTINDAQTKLLAKILTQKFSTTEEMKIVLCLINMILGTTLECMSDFNKLTDKLIEYITVTSKLQVNNSGIYQIIMFNNPDIQLILKLIPKCTNNSYIEYYIGIHGVNRLRYTLPTFLYTFGGFTCMPKPITTSLGCYMLHEKINGKPYNAYLSSPAWPLIFSQIVLSLEIAQRKLRFSHNDLHSGNIIVKYTPGFRYSILLDNYEYIIITDYVPVIIDFGTSSAYIDQTYIGTLNYTHVGIFNFLIPGTDIYKLMINSCVDGTERHKTLFGLYETSDDVYNIANLAKIPYIKEDIYFKNVAFSNAGTYTPMMLFEYMLKTYPDMSIIVKPRDKYIIPSFPNTLVEYDRLLGQSLNNIKKLLNNLDKKTNNYITNKYIRYMLEQYKNNQNLTNDEKEIVNSAISQYFLHTDCINTEIAKLNKLFNIKLPNDNQIHKLIDSILSIPIRETNPEKKQNIDITILDYISEMKPYLQFYYIIIELNEQENYKSWLEDPRLRVYIDFYYNNATQINRALRWRDTLLATISPINL